MLGRAGVLQVFVVVLTIPLAGGTAGPGSPPCRRVPFPFTRSQGR